MLFSSNDKQNKKLLTQRKEKSRLSSFTDDSNTDGLSSAFKSVHFDSSRDNIIDYRKNTDNEKNRLCFCMPP